MGVGPALGRRLRRGNPRGRDIGGGGAAFAVGARSGPYTARLSGANGSGVFLDSSQAWEVAALVGAVKEVSGGRLRFGLAIGPGLGGGRTNGVCFLCTFPRGSEVLPTRLGVATLIEAHVFVTPGIGFGVQAPLSVYGGEVARGVMVGWKFEGL